MAPRCAGTACSEGHTYKGGCALEVDCEIVEYEGMPGLDSPYETLPAEGRPDDWPTDEAWPPGLSGAWGALPAYTEPEHITWRFVLAVVGCALPAGAAAGALIAHLVR